MKILVLPGDGIGPEITAATLQVLRAADAALSCGLEFETRDIGLASLRAEGTTLPKAVLARIPEVDGVLLGPVSHLDYPTRQEGGLNPSAELRTRFELFANIRPCRSREGLTLLRKPMDLVIVRENTEGFYADRNMFEGSGEFAPDPDMALSLRKVTAKGSRRVAKAAFRLASRQGQRPEAHGRPIFALGTQGRRGISRCRARGADRRCHGGAPHSQSGPLRRDRHHQHVRRHPLG